MKIKDVREHYLYYFLIVFLSLIAIIFLPMLGLDQKGEIKFNFPKSPIAWAVWGISKACVIVINLLIFHFFVLQGKDNVRDNPIYIDGMERLGKLKNREYIPLSPMALEKREYLKKGGTVILTTAMSLLALPSLVLQFNLLSFLSVLFSMAMAFAFGFMQMRETEDRWTNKLKEYVDYIEKQEVINDNCKRQNLEEPSGTSLSQYAGHRGLQGGQSDNC